MNKVFVVRLSCHINQITFKSVMLTKAFVPQVAVSWKTFDNTRQYLFAAMFPFQLKQFRFRVACLTDVLVSVKTNKLWCQVLMPSRKLSASSIETSFSKYFKRLVQKVLTHEQCYKNWNRQWRINRSYSIIF